MGTWYFKTTLKTFLNLRLLGLQDDVILVVSGRGYGDLSNQNDKVFPQRGNLQNHRSQAPVPRPRNKPEPQQWKHQILASSQSEVFILIMTNWNKLCWLLCHWTWLKKPFIFFLHCIVVHHKLFKCADTDLRVTVVTPNSLSLSTDTHGSKRQLSWCLEACTQEAVFLVFHFSFNLFTDGAVPSGL